MAQERGRARRGRAARAVWWCLARGVLLCMLADGATGVSSGQSTISFCVADKAAHSTYFLSDLTAPMPGQSVADDQYSQGRLVLGGGFLPNPTVELIAANQTVVVNGTIDWSHSAHRRAAAYADALAKLCARADLTSSHLFSVVPIGLAGSPSDSQLKGVQVLRNSGDGASAGWSGPAPASPPLLKSASTGFTSLFFWRAPVPRLWPMVAKTLRGDAAVGAGGADAGADAGGKQPGGANKGESDERHVVVSSIVRFVVSLQRFRVRVVDEEAQYLASLSAQKTRRTAPGGGDPHPDLREGLLRSDLPKAYVSEIGYGHRLLVSVNISVPVVPHKPPANLDSAGHLLMRVVARDVSASDFDRMFPGVSLYARMRWDPDLAPPLEAIKHMQDMRDVFYGEPWGGGAWNHTLQRCPKGSFRRSKHQPSTRVKPASCPADEWPSMRAPEASWVLYSGGAQSLQERIEAWRSAMSRSKVVCLCVFACDREG